MWYKMQFSAEGMHGAGKILWCKLCKRPWQANFPGLAAWLPLHGRRLWLPDFTLAGFCWRYPKLYAEVLPHSQCTAWKAHLLFFVLLMLPIYKGPASSRKSSCLFPVYQWILPPGKPGCPLSPPLIGTYFLSWGMQGSLIISAQGSVLKASIQFYRLPPTWAWEHIFLFSLSYEIRNQMFLSAGNVLNKFSVTKSAPKNNHGSSHWLLGKPYHWSGI